MKWEKVEIGNLVTLRQGLAINKQTNHYVSEDPTSLPLLRIGDMKNGEFSIFIKESIPEKFIAKLHNIIYTRTGQVGLVFRRQHGVVHNNCFTVNSNNENLLNQDFLYYALKEKSFYEEALSRATGAAQPDLPHDAFKTIRFFLPPVKTQKKIADILSAYDDLIENNQEQIKLLEEAAQRLYKEWFVDLRFPGYEATPISGGIPQGWKKVPFGEIIGYEIGGGWGEDESTDKCDQQSFVIRGTDFYDITHGKAKTIPYRYQSESSLKSRILQDGDVIFEVSGGSRTEGVARTAFIRQSMLDFWGIPVICASFCKLIRFKDKQLSQYMYDTLQYLRNSGETGKYDKRSASSIVNYRWKDFLEQEEILVPTHDILQKYNIISENVYSMIITKSQAMEKSAEARDRLLPKLMSGEIEVK